MSSNASAVGSSTVVLAVKALDDAKSRLAPLSQAQLDRRPLVVAMLADTLTAVAAAHPAAIVVVTPDPTIATLARSVGALVVAEPAAPTPGWSALNTALAAGGAVADTETVIYLQADLPTLHTRSLHDAADAAHAALIDAPAAFVADRSGTGTTMLVTTTAFAPRFGRASAVAHCAANAVELDPSQSRWPDLRTDIDTPADLHAATVLGLGRRTREFLAPPRSR